MGQMVSRSNVTEPIDSRDSPSSIKKSDWFFIFKSTYLNTNSYTFVNTATLKMSLSHQVLVDVMKKE